MAISSVEYSSLALAASSAVASAQDTIMWRDTSAPNVPESFYLMTFATLASIIQSVLPSSSSAGITYGNSVPLSGSGSEGDSYIDRTTKILYEKGASTWSSIGTLALSASNLEATFVTPSAGNKSATLG